MHLDILLKWHSSDIVLFFVSMCFSVLSYIYFHWRKVQELDRESSLCQVLSILFPLTFFDTLNFLQNPSHKMCNTTNQLHKNNQETLLFLIQLQSSVCANKVFTLKFASEPINDLSVNTASVPVPYSDLTWLQFMVNQWLSLPCGTLYYLYDTGCYFAYS